MNKQTIFIGQHNFIQCHFVYCLSNHLLGFKLSPGDFIPLLGLLIYSVMEEIHISAFDFYFVNIENLSEFESASHMHHTKTVLS